jgi:hypothetical protein
MASTIDITIRVGHFTFIKNPEEGLAFVLMAAHSNQMGYMHLPFSLNGRTIYGISNPKGTYGNSRYPIKYF